MRQTLMNAAIHMAFSIGVRQNAWKLTSKLDIIESELKADFMQYVETATEMFELAEEMAMSTPQGAPDNYYNGVGDWYAVFCRENSEMPSREEMLQGMAEGINKIFQDTLSHTQRDSLKAKLAEFE